MKLVSNFSKFFNSSEVCLSVFSKINLSSSKRENLVDVEPGLIARISRAVINKINFQVVLIGLGHQA